MSCKTQMDTLTTEQRDVFNVLLRGDNVFLTGGGGVGKSYLLSLIYTDFPRMSGGKKIQMCAMTGCAALLLGNKAKTLHSWAGIGLGKGTVQELLTKIRRNRKAMKNWITTDLLIVDEISMLTGELLDKLDELGRKIRSNRRPFGGLQLLLSGDMFQLPPVSRDGPVLFAFESAAWKGINAHMELTQIQRQKDVAFQEILREARHGKLTEKSCEVLRSREGLDWRANKIKPTLLFPRRAEVEMINETNLRALKGPWVPYAAKLAYDGKVPIGFMENDPIFQQALQRMDSDAPYAASLELAVGSQVMLVANLSPGTGLVNGSRGVVVEISPIGGLPVVEFMNGVRQPIGTHSWPVEEYEFVSRTQIPLRLSWACTTHKSQGSSLDSVLVDIGNSNFEFGQAYVSLSRARDLEGLYVYDFDPIAFKAHPKVMAFYETMPRTVLTDAERIPSVHEQPEVAVVADAVNAVVADDDVKVDAVVADAVEPGAPSAAEAAMASIFQQNLAREQEEKKERARQKARETRAAKKAAKGQ